jgi:hypothetical protein
MRPGAFLACGLGILGAAALSWAESTPAGPEGRIGPERLGAYVAGALGLHASPKVWTQDLQRAKDLGLGVLRFNSDTWTLLEPKPGHYEWNRLDKIVALAEAQDMSLIFTLPISSQWNRPDTPLPSGVSATHVPTRDLESLAAFSAALSSRYKGRIRYYEVWNEPDWPPFWKGNPDPAEYLALLQAASGGLRAGDPAARVLIGGLARPVDAGWLAKLLELGGGKFFDIMNIHVYPAGGTLAESLAAVRDALGRHGLKKPLWITETSSTGAYFDTPDRVREEKAKAAYLVRTYAEALSDPGVECVVWHTLRNCGRDIGLPRDWDFGLMTAEGEPLPAHQAHRTLARMLLGARPLGKQAAPAGVSAYAFAQEGRHVWVVWTDRNQIQFPLPGSWSRVRVTTASGRTQDLGRRTSVSASPKPVFVEAVP